MWAWGHGQSTLYLWEELEYRSPEYLRTPGPQAEYATAKGMVVIIIIHFKFVSVNAPHGVQENPYLGTSLTGIKGYQVGVSLSRNFLPNARQVSSNKSTNSSWLKPSLILSVSTSPFNEKVVLLLSNLVHFMLTIYFFTVHTK